MDRRDEEAAIGKWYKSLDVNRMVVVVTVYGEDKDEDIEEDVELPFKYEVCDLCLGKGSHVNPSIDAHGISVDEFAEDPEFREAYMAGRYDVICYRCGGSNVEPVICTEHLTDEQKKYHEMILENQQNAAEAAAESAWERRMGY